MSLREVELSTTPTPEAIADLRLGDIVYLTGLMYTAPLIWALSPRRRRSALPNGCPSGWPKQARN